MKTGEKLIRTLIAELDDKIKALQAGAAVGRLGPLTVRARMRWFRQDYDKLCAIARNYGFKV
jgi:hypothetical protein